MSESAIINFFTDQTVFLTGGTGFLGRVLVEKILRVCEVKKIYLLVRPKKGKSVEERFNDYFNIPCFENLKKCSALIREKLVFVTGDCEQTNLGISKATEELLIEETNIVIHAAANVKFDQPLRFAANVNVRSTMDILNLAKKMTQLKSFVYVSTAFSNCPIQEIEEKCYPPPMTAKDLFFFLDIITDDTVLATMTPILLKDWPNTYTFTKSIAEGYLNSEGGGLRVGIVRPSIVLTTAEEPFPGWIDNFYGITGITAAAGLGVLKSINVSLHSTAHLIPCDFVSNSVLAATWDVANDKSNNIKFYNCPSEGKNILTWGQFYSLCTDKGLKFPPSKALWYYCLKFRENATWHKICVFFLHTVLAYIADFVLICIGRQPLAVNNYIRLNQLLELTSYFTTRKWIFINTKTRNLWMKLSPRDKQLFNFDMDNLDFSSYLTNFFIGGRTYLLKDPLETVPRALKRHQYLKIVHYASLAIFYFVLYKFFVLILNFFI